MLRNISIVDDMLKNILDIFFDEYKIKRQKYSIKA